MSHSASGFAFGFAVIGFLWCFAQDPPAIGHRLQLSIDKSLERCRKTTPYAVLNHAQLRKPDLVEKLEKSDKPLVLVHPEYGYDVDERGERSEWQNRKLLEWMVAKATYAPNVSTAKTELRSLLKNAHFIPNLPPTLFERLQQQLKARMDDLGKVMETDATTGVDLSFRLNQFMHPCTECPPPQSSPEGYRASQLDIFPAALKDGLDQAVLQPRSEQRCPKW